MIDHPRPWVRLLAGVLLVACFLWVQSTAVAQDTVQLQTSDSPIPADYKSWSLFLICNPAWALPQSEERLWELFSQFRAFGGAIGPTHAAVWFWSRDDISEPHTAIDAVRSSAFCSRLGLSPAKGPYVVVSSDYPGEGKVSDYPESFAELEDFSVIDLDGRDAAEITQLLSKLVELVVAEEISSVDPGSKDFWSKWRAAFEAAQTTLPALARRIRVSIHTSFFDVEIE